MRPEHLTGHHRALRAVQAGVPQCVRDERTQQWRVSSGAFSPTGDGFLSVDLEQLLEQDAKPLDFKFPRLPRVVALVAHRVENYRTRGLAVHHQPRPLNYYHGGVEGPISKKDKRQLAQTAEFIRPIDEKLAEKYANPEVR